VQEEKRRARRNKIAAYKMAKPEIVYFLSSQIGLKKGAKQRRRGLQTISK